MNANDPLRMTAVTAMFAALTAVGAYIALPVGPVPVVLQNLFVYLMGLTLAPKWGLAGIGAYLMAGAAGLPVFAGGRGGIGHLIGPTGGYLVGYLPAVYVMGLISTRGRRHPAADIAALAAGTLLIYTPGVAWLMHITGMTLRHSLVVGMLPFLIGDILKTAAAFALAKTLRPVLDHG